MVDCALQLQTKTSPSLLRPFLLVFVTVMEKITQALVPSMSSLSLLGNRKIAFQESEGRPILCICTACSDQTRCAHTSAVVSPATQRPLGQAHQGGRIPCPQPPSPVFGVIWFARLLILASEGLSHHYLHGDTISDSRGSPQTPSFVPISAGQITVFAFIIIIMIVGGGERWEGRGRDQEASFIASRHWKVTSERTGISSEPPKTKF